MEFFDDDEKLVADILVQLSEQVPANKRRTWGSTALRSVLVNIPPPYKSSPQIVPRPSESNAVPRLPESLPSSLNPRPAPAGLRLKIKSPGTKLMRTDVPLGEATPHLVEEAVNCGREVSECRIGMDRSNETRHLPKSFLIPKETFVTGGATSHLVEEAVNCGREELECRMGVDGSKERRAIPNGCMIPNDAVVMGYWIQSLQFNKSAVYAEARRKRKLHMEMVKSSKRPCL